MSIENDIFQRYSPDFKKLIKFGFKKGDSGYLIEKNFRDNSFRAIITVNLDGKVSGKVFDLENDDEFLPLRVDGNGGSFIGEIRAEYEDLLKNIRENCFVRQYYIFPQSNRITNLIIEKYGDEPEFLWEKFQGSGVFRNPETKKWYLAILDVDRGKIQPGKKGLIEVCDLKLAPEKIEELLEQKHYYPGYHMNKKSWITIILDDSVLDDEIMELVDMSHKFSEKKR